MASLSSVIVAGGDAAAAVARVEMLRPAGYAGLAVSNGFDVQKFVRDRQPDIVLFEGAFDDVDVFEVIGALKRHEATRHVPRIMLNVADAPGALDDGFEAGLDDMVEAGATADIILARLQPLVRLSSMHAEFRQRIASAGEFGLVIDIDAVHDVNTKNSRVLIVGAESGRVAGLVDMLAATEFSPLREADHFNAGARIAEEVFDAAVIVVEQDGTMAKALTLCAHIRNSPRLFNLPVLVAAGQEISDPGALPYAQGASMAVPLTRDGRLLTAGLRFLVRRQRQRWNLHGPLTATLQAETADALDGLYSERFLRAHLARLLKRGAAGQRPLSLALFSIQSAAGAEGSMGDGASIMQQAADCVSAMIRVEDMAARLGRSEICAVLPGAARREAERAMNRIAGSLANRDFKHRDGSPTASPVWVQGDAVAAAPGETAEALIARARVNLT